MSDIVEHLRDCAKYADEYPSDKDAFNGAAKEITRLRGENARLREAHEKIGYDFSLNRDEAAIVARVAICKGGNDAK